MSEIKFKKKHLTTLWVTYTFKQFIKGYWDLVENNINESDNIIDAIIAEYILIHNLKFEFHP